jgi:hypothetical protein
MGMSKNKRAVHVATIKKRHNGKTYVTHLLRRTFRENGKVKHVTVGNLSDLPDDLIEVIRRRLAGDPLPAEERGFRIVRSLPHGHVAAVLGTLKKIGLDGLISSKPCREAELVVAMIALRIISPGSKLANLTGLQPETAEHSLGSELQLEDIETAEMYQAMDWLLKRQTRIENKLAKRHLADGMLVLYDVSSSYYTGRQSELIKMGYSRDGKPGEPQIVYGLLCAADGCPVAIEVFSGNTADPTTFTAQVNKIRKRFGIRRLVLVGDRGMITSKRLDEKIAAEAALDGLYVIRTSVPAETLSAERTVATYKDLSQVEWAFRSMKSVDLKVRPIYHWKDDRIRAHVFLCMLAYYVEWHMRGKLAELLFDDHERELAEETRESIVAKAPRSEAARRKERKRRTLDGFPVQSFQCLLKDLAT